MAAVLWAGAANALDEEFIDVRVEVVGLTSPLLPNCTAELERLTDHQRVRPVELPPDLPGEAAQLSSARNYSCVVAKERLIKLSPGRLIATTAVKHVRLRVAFERKSIRRTDLV